jgi:hypothetical protein
MSTAPVKCQSVDPASIEFGDVVVDGARVSVPLKTALSVFTGPVVLCNAPLDPSDYEPVPFLTVKPTTAIGKRFFEAVEARLLAVAQSNSKEWFNGADTEVIKNSLKSFVKDGSVKLRLASDAVAFDAQGDASDLSEFLAGDTVRAVVETSAARLGKQEFGIVWRVVQLRRTPKAVCLIKDTDTDESLEEWDEFV